jgi:lipopolysaccharide assembly outer membrane protein LptD (OstA)
MVDYYANLGAYMGTDFYMPGKGILSTLNLSLGIGLTQTVVLDGGNYTPFFPNYDGTTDFPNKSNLFGKEIPFRYRFKTDSQIRGKYGSISWNIPLYSDPLMDSDFLDRSESMDWVNLIQKGAALDEKLTTQSYLQNYTWQLSSQITPKYPNMSP